MYPFVSDPSLLKWKRGWDGVYGRTNTGEKHRSDTGGQIVQAGWSGLPEKSLHSHGQLMKPKSAGAKVYKWTKVRGFEYVMATSSGVSTKREVVWGNSKQIGFGLNSYPCFCRWSLPLKGARMEQGFLRSNLGCLGCIQGFIEYLEVDEK